MKADALATALNAMKLEQAINYSNKEGIKAFLLQKLKVKLNYYFLMTLNKLKYNYVGNALNIFRFNVYYRYYVSGCALFGKKPITGSCGGLAGLEPEENVSCVEEILQSVWNSKIICQKKKGSYLLPFLLVFLKTDSLCCLHPQL